MLTFGLFVDALVQFGFASLELTFENVKRSLDLLLLGSAEVVVVDVLPKYCPILEVVGDLHLVLPVCPECLQ